jgi:hypothetical protein
MKGVGGGQVLFTSRGDDEVDKLHIMFLQPTQNNAQE